MKIAVLANVPLNPNQGSGYVITGYVRELQQLGHKVEMHTAFPTKSIPKGKGNRFRTRIGMRKALSLAKRSDCLLLWGGEAGWIMPRLMELPGRGAVIACSNGLETHVAHAYGTSVENLESNPATPCFRLADGIMVVSKFDLDFADRFGYLTPEKRVSISNPLPSEFLHRPSVAKDGKKVLFVGSWISRKGTDAIKEALPLVQAEVPGIQITLIGHGTSEMNRPGIEVIDPGVQRTELVRHYEEASVLMMPSQYESFGMVSSEAMACGCAVVSTPVGFPYELEHGKDCLHVPFNNGTELANAIVRLVSNPELRTEVAANGHHKVQELNWSKASQKLDEFVCRISNI